MRRYHKIVAICLILVLSLSVLSACKGGGDENALFEGGGLGPIQNTETPGGEQQTPNGEQQTPSGEQQTPNNQQQTPNNEQQTPNNEQTPGGEQTPNNEQTPGNENKEPDNTETPEEDLSNGINNYTTVCMSFNMLGYIGAPHSSPQERAPWILATIRKYDPDLLGAQEIGDPGSYNGNFDTFGYMVKNLSDYEAQNWHGVPNSQSLFWKKDRYEKKDCGFFDPAGYGLGYNWALLYDKKDKITVLFTNVHFNPGVGAEVEQSRNEQALSLMNNVWKKYCGKDVALYATGDYNTGLGSSTIELLSKEKYDCCADVTLNANHAPYIDHVFINGDIQQCVNFHTALETFEPEGMEPGSGGAKYKASDHNAVIAYCNNSKRKK